MLVKHIDIQSLNSRLVDIYTELKWPEWYGLFPNVYALGEINNLQIRM